MEQDAHTLTGGHADTDQRCPAGASAERLVKGRAAELQLLQVAVGNPDVSRQRQALVQVLKPTQQGGKFKMFFRLNPFMIYCSTSGCW